MKTLLLLLVLGILVFGCSALAPPVDVFSTPQPEHAASPALFMPKSINGIAADEAQITKTGGVVDGLDAVYGDTVEIQVVRADSPDTVQHFIEAQKEIVANETGYITVISSAPGKTWFTFEGSRSTGIIWQRGEWSFQVEVVGKDPKLRNEVIKQMLELQK